jgi:hypothetical protein
MNEYLPLWQHMIFTHGRVDTMVLFSLAAAMHVICNAIIAYLSRLRPSAKD